MKNLDEIKRGSGLCIEDLAADGGSGFIFGLDVKKPHKYARVVFSWGGGWDHVSVSFRDRCPTWEEMCRIKDMFFYPEERCVEYHPPASEYVNFHPYCLHIWRPQHETLPAPPKIYVGPSGSMGGDQ